MRRVLVAFGLATLSRGAPGSAAPSAPDDAGADGSCLDEAKLGSSSPLSLARALTAPRAADVDGAEFEHASFWEEHGALLREAWDEWDDERRKGSSATGRGSEEENVESGSEAILDPRWSRALGEAFADPSEDAEAAVRSLWTDVDGVLLPRGVHATKLLSPSGVAAIRDLLDSADASGVPARRPNGMNRRGVIVDPGVDGAVSMKGLVRLVEEVLIGRVARPAGRMLFPERVGCGDDAEYFAFTIRYDGDDDAGEKSGGDPEKPVRDVQLKEHRDASVVTLNVNLNLPREDYSGSRVFFRSTELPGPDGRAGGRAPDLGEGDARFAPGAALIHHGAHRHGSLPIAGSGGRRNLVIWLFGKDGDVRVAPYEEDERRSVEERWRGCGNHTRGFAFD